MYLGSEEAQVWPAGANAMALSLMRGRRVTLSKVDAFADGVAVKQASRNCPRSLTPPSVMPCTVARATPLLTPRTSQASPVHDRHAIAPAHKGA